MFKRIFLAIMICSSSACIFAASGPQHELAPLAPESTRAVIALLDVMKFNSGVDEKDAFSQSNFVHLVTALVTTLSSKGTLPSSVSITEYGLSTSPKKQLTPEMHSACTFLMSLAHQLVFKDVHMSQELFETYISRLKNALKASAFSLQGSYVFDGTSCIFKEK